MQRGKLSTKRPVVDPIRSQIRWEQHLDLMMSSLADVSRIKKTERQIADHLWLNLWRTCWSQTWILSVLIGRGFSRDSWKFVSCLCVFSLIVCVCGGGHFVYTLLPPFWTWWFCSVHHITVPGSWPPFCVEYSDTCQHQLWHHTHLISRCLSLLHVYSVF